ncbi:MAG: TIM barrel protein [Candidatus Marsarchaeota archaeon]
MEARFGPAGKPREYRGKSPEVIAYLAKEGLNAYEYEAVRGVKLSSSDAKKMKELAEALDVKLSIHAPYYVNLGSQDESIWEESLNRVRAAMEAAELMGATVVVVHPGYYGNSRQKALERVEKAIKELEKTRGGQEKIGLETMGRLAQIGSLEEVASISSKFPGLVVPVVDWAHLEARSQGRMRTEEDALAVLRFLRDQIGTRALEHLHCHFSKMEFSARGEIRHHDLGDAGFYPDFSTVASAVMRAGLHSITFIAETAALDKDALLMKETFAKLAEEEGIARTRWRPVA